MYLLDTDTVSSLIKPKASTHIKTHLAEVADDDLAISVITLMELYLGFYLSGQPESVRQFIEDWVLPSISVIDLDPAQAQQAAEIQSFLRQKGRVLDWLDVMIAACALTYGCVLVTGNTRHFQRIPDLIIENWLS